MVFEKIWRWLEYVEKYEQDFYENVQTLSLPDGADPPLKCVPGKRSWNIDLMKLYDLVFVVITVNWNVRFHNKY